MPKGMVLSSVVVTMLFLILFIIFGLSGIVSGTIKTVLFFVFLAATVFGIGISLWMILMYRTFSYDGERQMSRQIIEGIADYVKLPEGGNGLDVGCGSGALGVLTPAAGALLHNTSTIALSMKCLTNLLNSERN